MTSPSPATTRTGKFPIGFRRGGSWQQDIHALIRWTSANDFATIDLTGGDLAGDIAAVTAAGLRIGSVDLCDWAGWPALLSPDRSRRAAAVAATRERVERCAAAGVKNFFALMLPENPDLPRRENFAFMVESYSALVPTLHSAGAHVVIEGWPGPGALCCTPETYRAMFEQVPGTTLGVNYDPSHLLRMGIDPLRFLREFISRVHHVHAKDTMVADSEARYQFGHEQPATFAPSPAYGTPVWRYTIPGHGQTSWVEVFNLLEKAGYAGPVSIELEDAEFHGTEETEKRGLLLARQFLEGC